jgi:hypothetical protein
MKLQKHHVPAVVIAAIIAGFFSFAGLAFRAYMHYLEVKVENESKIYQLRLKSDLAQLKIESSTVATKSAVEKIEKDEKNSVKFSDVFNIKNYGAFLKNIFKR